MDAWANIAGYVTLTDAPCWYMYLPDHQRLMCVRGKDVVDLQTGAYGLRPIVTLKSGVKVKKANLEHTTHTTPETAWTLVLEE